MICTGRKVCNKTMSPPAALLFKRRGIEHTTVKFLQLCAINGLLVITYVNVTHDFNDAFFIFDFNNNSNICTTCHNILQVAFTYFKGSYPK